MLKKKPKEYIPETCGVEQCSRLRRKTVGSHAIGLPSELGQPKMYRDGSKAEV